VSEPEAGSGPWIVVGLGNPGPAYAGHRHNVGYLVAEELLRRIGVPFKAHRGTRTDLAEGRLGIPGQLGPRVVVVRPRCYMNEVGGPVKAVLSFFGVPTERLVAVHDELDIPFDTMRVKFAGGDNGHNGLRSIRGSLGTGSAARRAGRTRRTSCCRTTPAPSARRCRSRWTAPPTRSRPC
jgi:PTH1 family peptidyl-tRNA hydrolase